ncbi:hypothetical protein RUM44_005259 [Polyplax serrata]|uniref:Uncharacterized protein n=1 Tax=Polyplax serrata TaxID=468196 RepID=A0ABR1AEH7_POLSC
MREKENGGEPKSTQTLWPKPKNMPKSIMRKPFHLLQHSGYSGLVVDSWARERALAPSRPMRTITGRTICLIIKIMGTMRNLASEEDDEEEFGSNLQVFGACQRPTRGRPSQGFHPRCRSKNFGP